MSLTKIGDERWDFVDAAGGETRLSEGESATATFPTRWRVFGPLKAFLKNTGQRLAGKQISSAGGGRWRRLAGLGPYDGHCRRPVSYRGEDRM